MAKPAPQDKDTLIKSWVDRIKAGSLPAFSKSVQLIACLGSDDDLAVEKLSDYIKRDAALSTRILRASNSVYRIRRGRVNTISRAIVMLGIKEVRKICLTCSLIDGLLDDSPPEEIKREMSMAFYSATQARLFSIKRGDPHSEEVFLSALMLNIGPLAIWKVAYKEMLKVYRFVQIENCPLEEAEISVFGFTLAELSRALIKEWQLEQFIPTEESPSENEQKRLQEIELSSSLARSVQFGWNSEVVTKIIKSLEELLSTSLEALMAMLRDANREMLEMAESFDIQPPLEPATTVPSRARKETTIIADDIPEETEARALKLSEKLEQAIQFTPIEPSLEFQMEALRNLSSLMALNAAPTMYILHAMAGMHRGVGLDRVVFAMLNNSRTILSGRLAEGAKADFLKEQFSFGIATGEEALIPYVFKRGQAFWLQNVSESERQTLGIEMISSRTEASDFFLAPLIVSNQWIGMFYADMLPSERELSQQYFDEFDQFAVQATLACQHYEYSKQLADAPDPFDPL